MIYYLVYISAASHLYSDAELSQILLTSQVNNERKDITGILLYHEGSLLQVLEGDKETVTELYLKIKQDERHNNVIQMTGGFCEERNFPDWSMGFKSVNSSDWEEYSAYLDLNSLALIKLIKKKNPRIDTMVKSFVNTNLK